MSYLGDLVRDRREGAGLSRQGLAARLGYTNTNKGARRLEAIESGAEADEGLIRKVLAALGSSPDEAAEALWRDEKERAAAALQAMRTPAEPELWLRVMPGLSVREGLPAGDAAELEAAACERARETGLRVCLVLPSRVTLWIDPDGRVYERLEPDAAGAARTPTLSIRGAAMPDILRQREQYWSDDGDE